MQSRDQFLPEKGNSHSNTALDSAPLPRKPFKAQLSFLKNLQGSWMKVPTKAPGHGNLEGYSP